MPIDITPGSFAAVTITTLFWWTALSPVGLLAVAVLCARRPRLRGALTIWSSSSHRSSRCCPWR